MRFIVKNSDRLAKAINHLSALPFHKAWQVDIKEHKPSRSNSQNNLYWMWLGELGNFMGEEAEELHEKFAVKFLGVQEKEVQYKQDGEVKHEILRKPRSTTSLTTKEFTTYLNNIEVTILTAFPDFQLPIPDDYNYAMGRS